MAERVVLRQAPVTFSTTHLKRLGDNAGRADGMLTRP
jgi:hypothetical protein